MSALANALRAVVVKSSHPNSLIYQVQVERARKKHVERGLLEGGQQEGVVALGAPEETGAKRALETGSGGGPGGAERENRAVGGEEAEAEAEAGRGDAGGGGGGKDEAQSV